MSVGTIMGNTLALGTVKLFLTPAAVAATTSAEQTFLMPGIRPRDTIINVSKQSAFPAGLGIGNARASANDTVAITFINATAGALTPTAGEEYRITYHRVDADAFGVIV